jgi:hypothetical protein
LANSKQNTSNLITKKSNIMYYRVFDHQRGIYFATGYNNSSMQELIESFRSYIYGAGEDVEENLQTWEQIADYLSDVELEQNETPFEELNW